MIENLAINLAQHGKDRCGSGFGKYPLGILEAVHRLAALVPESQPVKDSIAAFEERLSR